MADLKAEFRRLRPVIRDLWNDFDPIGLGTPNPASHGEYEAYVPVTIRLVLEGADRSRFEQFIQNCVWDDMGLAGQLDEEIGEFAERLSKVSV